MKIGILGSGTWGISLAVLLASKGQQVTVWAADPEQFQQLSEKRVHPKLPGVMIPESIQLVSSLEKALKGQDLISESVTSGGIRPVFSKIKELGVPDCPIVITSKGIEQGTGLLLPEVAVEVLGESHRMQVGCLSGPSHAEEVIKNLPTSVVASGYSQPVISKIVEAFTTPTFRVYPNTDINGVAFGGAMKNVIAISCGLSDGLGFGDNTRAALMTRGLHEIRKLSVMKGCNPETLNGLAGMGDLCVTCMSTLSRNYQFGRGIAEGASPEEVKQNIGMVVEGAYTCVSALELGRKGGIPLPITETMHAILYEEMSPKDAVAALMQRAIKEEHL